MTNVRTAWRVTSRACLLLLCGSISLLSQPCAQAQFDGMTYSRTPFSGSSSGSASSTMDENRRGFGMRFRGGHDAGNTVGRLQSVSHVELSPYFSAGDSYLFGDSRIVMDNGGDLAWSFGTGYRHYLLGPDIVVGGYGYFDRDQTTGAHFRSWTFGGELLANRWEARGNYYRPFGNTSEMVGSRIDQSSAAFVANNITFNQINSFAEALEGFDSEIGVLLPGKLAEQFDVRAFGGGYYYQGENIPGFSGFSTRLQADIADWLELSLKVTDDSQFSTNVAFNAVVHFGGFKSQEHTRRSAIQRFAEPVRRNLTIATSTSDVATAPLIAINPATGLPFNVVHVNSNDLGGPFIGTVEDPLNSLASGLAVPGADLVFVHAGSTFAAAPDNTVVLATNQNLFGEGLIAGATGNRKVMNEITVDGISDPLILPDSPTFASNLATLGPAPFGPLLSTAAIDPILLRPMLSGSAGNAVTLGDGSSFGGFIIDGPGGNGIFSDGVGGTRVSDVLVQNAGGAGILLQNTMDSTTILDTIITNATGPAFHVNGGTGVIGFTSTSVGLDPAFGHIENTSQEAVLIENMTAGSVNMFRSTINDTGGAGIVIRDTASNATIDNANIQDSTGTGISVTNSSGDYAFRNSLRNATVVNNAAGPSVLISGTTGRTLFDNLSITNPNGAGIDINNLEGNVTFSQDVTIGNAASGTAAAVSVDSTLAGGSVQFARALTINGSLGRGIELLSNADGSSFSVNGLTTIVSAATQGIAILNDSGSTVFAGGTGISQRGAEGIQILNSDGVVSFQQGTGVDNLSGSTAAAVDIQDSEALVLFESLGILNATGNPGGGAGVNLVNNVAGTNGPAQMIFNNVDIQSNGGVGFFGFNNESIRVGTGNVNSNLAAAVDIEQSGINIHLDTLTSTGSPDFGLRLVETNRPGMKTFDVGPQVPNAFGLGGAITGAGISGAQLENGGQISLKSVSFDDNQTGITVLNSGITTTDDQFLELLFVSMTRSNFRGIDGQNLTLLDIQDSLFDDNGDNNPAVAGADLDRETIRMTYTEVPNDPDTTLFIDYDNPYVINVERTTFVDNSDDILNILNTASAVGAHIDVNVQDSSLTVTDVLDVNPLDLSETGFKFAWNGPARVRLANNNFELNGFDINETETAMDIQTFSITDELLTDIISNGVVSVQPNATALQMQTLGMSSSNITGNAFQMDGFDSTGMTFRLAANTLMDISNNLMAFNGDGGAGMIFNSVSQPSAFNISGNQIGLFDLGVGTLAEEGIRFRAVAGTINLSGLNNNLVFLLNPGGGSFIETPFSFVGSANGRILVNGALVP
ncbi:MAG: right-handed parallel beta-helix repeat-containing protein [Planctomycetaceae bacterium]